MCVVNIPQGSDADIKWLDPNDDIIDNSTISIHLMTNVLERSPSGIQYTSSITFSPLQVSHNGAYACTVPSVGSSSKDVIAEGILLYHECTNLN